MAAAAQPVVVTANLIADGAPVYLTQQNTWSRKLAEAQIVERAEQREALIALARGQEALVCDPYAFKVAAGESTPKPLSTRERIRAVGPTTRIRRPD